jgi:hypothetical protein
MVAFNLSMIGCGVPRLADPLADDPRHQVGRRADDLRDDHLDRPGRVALLCAGEHRPHESRGCDRHCRHERMFHLSRPSRWGRAPSEFRRKDCTRRTRKTSARAAGRIALRFAHPFEGKTL